MGLPVFRLALSAAELGVVGLVFPAAVHASLLVVLRVFLPVRLGAGLRAERGVRGREFLAALLAHFRFGHAGRVALGDLLVFMVFVEAGPGAELAVRGAVLLAAVHARLDAEPPHALFLQERLAAGLVAKGVRGVVAFLQARHVVFDYGPAAMHAPERMFRVLVEAFLGAVLFPRGRVLQPFLAAHLARVLDGRVVPFLVCLFLYAAFYLLSDPVAVAGAVGAVLL